MITFRCTKKLRKYLGAIPAENAPPPTAALGDWYANLVPTCAGDLILFASEKSLLTVALPIWESDRLVPLFRIRVANLLWMIGIPPKIIAREVSHFDQVQFCKTASRSVLASMNDFAWHYQIMAEESDGESRLSLSKAEVKMAQMPCGALRYQFPSEVAKELLSVQEKNTS
ncbi:MAG: hypothetical protein J7K66_04820 [Anaerolineaceae bacterium]|nr:hypothetical protein [Anaerolineaceae bacterium]